MVESEKIIELVVEISPQLFALVKEVIKSNQEIEKSQLQNISKKLDDLVIRDIQSAFLIIEGINNVDSKKMKMRHLDEAERSLLKNISLDPTLVTAGKNNSYWNAQAYYGLSLIATLRNEKSDAGRFLLQAFSLCPSEARNRFAKPLYLTAFEPHCRTIMEWYQSELKRIPDYLARASEIKWKINKERMKLAGIWALGGAGFLMMSGVNRNMALASAAQQSKAIEREMASLQSALRSVPTEATLKTALEAKLDAKCRELVTGLLSQRQLTS
jgi:tetratricopeptide (TPR) repeat protein